MYFFKQISLKNCVGEDAGYFKLVRSGAIQCNTCDLYMDENLTRDGALEEFTFGPS